MRIRIATALVAFAVATVSLCWAASASFAQASAARAQRFDVVLGLKRSQQNLNRFVRTVARPGSPAYGDYLSPSQVGRRFGAGRHVARRVRGFLGRRGIPSELDVTRSFVEALVNAPKARRLFGGPKGPEGAPSALRHQVRQVLLLPARPGQVLPGQERAGAGDSASPRPAQGSLTPPHVRSGTPAGCPEGQNATFSYAPDGPVAGPAFTPNQIGDAYGATPLHDSGVTGIGVRVAIYGAGGFGRTELEAFVRCFGFEAPATHLVEVGTNDPGPTTGEAALDFQMVALMAPGIESLSTYAIGSNHLPVGFSAMIDPANGPGGQAPHVISVSQGDCETAEGRPAVRLTEFVLAAAAASGITVTAGSGDNGSFCPDGPNRAFYPSASRWMTSVGGTAFTLNRENGIVDEIPWNDQEISDQLGLGGGGGVSRFLKRPPFQRGLGRWGDHRAYPDVSLLADSYPGIAIYCNENRQGNCDASQPGNPFTAGFGTSAATPLFAGIVALADQRLLAAGRPPIGFANPLLYRLGREGGHGALRDVVNGSNSVFWKSCCEAVPGYDRASGWGSLNAERLGAIALRRGPR